MQSTLFEHTDSEKYVWTVFLVKNNLMIQVSGGNGSYGRIQDFAMSLSAWHVSELRRNIRVVPTAIRDYVVNYEQTAAGINAS
jgi:hypothetical protein